MDVTLSIRKSLLLSILALTLGGCKAKPADKCTYPDIMPLTLEPSSNFGNTSDSVHLPLFPKNYTLENIIFSPERRIVRAIVAGQSLPRPRRS
jgi:hypothetical protein